jgi:hypothetical protein
MLYELDVKLAKLVNSGMVPRGFDLLEMSHANNPYGFHFFDKPPNSKQEERDEDEYGENSCPDGCCDFDCECDDCLRCQDNGILDPDSFADEASAA